VARLTFPVSNALAQELGSDRDRILNALAERLGGEVFLRGNEVSVEGTDDVVGRARIVIEELGSLVEQGLAIGPQTIDALGPVLDSGAAGADALHDVVWRHRGKKIAPKTLNQKRYVDAIRSSTVTFGIGPAGTGKTYLAMALAVSALIDREVSRIVLTRPAVEAGEHLGFLPGDLQAKVDPYLRPLFDAVYDMMDADRLQVSMEKGLIEVAPLAFMRGRTLNDSFIILDEAQNTTPEQMQMFLTRLGFGSKIVVTGDVTQTDLRAGQRSGLVDVEDLLRGIPDIEFVQFGSEDVVRHKLVARIVSAYTARTQANTAAAAARADHD
jgi:phosphate starvation-inducible PhoH-like protein